MLITLLTCTDTFAEAVVPLQFRNNLDTFYVNVGISGTSDESYLVDTGAGYMTITERTLSTLQQAGTATYVRDLEGQLADGSVLRVPVYRLDQITVGQVCDLYDVEAAVLPGASRGLFGLSALRMASPFEVSFEPPTLRLKNCRGAEAPQPFGAETPAQ